MLNVKNLFARTLLALTLASGAGMALAAPTTYHVNVDTSSFEGNGYLDLNFGALGNAEQATAYLSNFTGSLVLTVSRWARLLAVLPVSSRSAMAQGSMISRS